MGERWILPPQILPWRTFRYWRCTVAKWLKHWTMDLKTPGCSPTRQKGTFFSLQGTLSSSEEVKNSTKQTILYETLWQPSQSLVPRLAVMKLSRHSLTSGTHSAATQSSCARVVTATTLGSADCELSICKVQQMFYVTLQIFSLSVSCMANQRSNAVTWLVWSVMQQSIPYTLQSGWHNPLHKR